MTAQDVIAQALALSEAATDGPWKAEGWTVHAPHLYPDLDDLIADCTDQPDAEFIAAARTLLPALAKALGAVMAACDVAEDEGHYSAWVPVRAAITAALSEVTP